MRVVVFSLQFLCGKIYRKHIIFTSKKITLTTADNSALLAQHQQRTDTTSCTTYLQHYNNKTPVCINPNSWEKLSHTFSFHQCKNKKIYTKYLSAQKKIISDATFSSSYFPLHGFCFCIPILYLEMVVNKNNASIVDILLFFFFLLLLFLFPVGIFCIYEKNTEQLRWYEVAVLVVVCRKERAKFAIVFFSSFLYCVFLLYF